MIAEERTRTPSAQPWGAEGNTSASAVGPRPLSFGTEFKNPNLAAIAEAVGIRGSRIEDVAEVTNGIAAALAHDGPVLVDAVVNPSERRLDYNRNGERGFTLYMAKAIMSGRDDEIIDLVKTNLWR